MATNRTFQLGPVKVRVSTPGEQPRPRLSRELIVSVALAQMAESGYDAVSMRTIARELGTGAASLYAHVANKDELDQLVIDRISSMITAPTPDPSRWEEQVKQMMRDLLDAYRHHPGSAQAALATIPTHEGGLRLAEALMATLMAGGIGVQAAAWFTDLVALYVSAIAAEESVWIERGKARAAEGEHYREEEVVASVRDVFASLPPAIYPILSSQAEVMTTGDGDDRFEFGLDVLLAGLEVVSARMSS